MKIARERLSKNGNKGFTLIELIVVIVIIAILVAALTPAILGVIDRANLSADQADARQVMMAAMVMTTETNPPSMPPDTRAGHMFNVELNGHNILSGTAFAVHFNDSGLPVAVEIVENAATTRVQKSRQANTVHIGLAIPDLTATPPVTGGFVAHANSPIIYEVP